MLICGMMNGMISSAHNWPHFSMDTVMDVGCPHSGGKKQELMGELMHRHIEKGPSVWKGLEDSINGVESKAGKGTESVLLVVLVMDVVQLAAGGKNPPRNVNIFNNRSLK